jgi:hypothetical protein
MPRVSLPYFFISFFIVVEVNAIYNEIDSAASLTLFKLLLLCLLFSAILQLAFQLAYC